MIWGSWVRTPVESNLGCLLLLSNSNLIQIYYIIVYEVTDGQVVRAGVSVTWNVLSWSGGHEFEPRSSLGCIVLRTWSKIFSLNRDTCMLLYIWILSLKTSKIFNQLRALVEYLLPLLIYLHLFAESTCLLLFCFSIKVAFESDILGIWLCASLFQRFFLKSADCVHRCMFGCRPSWRTWLSMTWLCWGQHNRLKPWYPHTRLSEHDVLLYKSFTTYT